MKGLTIHRDGREVLDLKTVPGRFEYARRTAEMAERQNNFCAICMEWMAEPSFDHQDGRGHGGGHREDRCTIDGKWQNAALCLRCNGNKGSRRFHWQGMFYIPAVYATLADAQRDGYKTDCCDDGCAPWLPNVVQIAESSPDDINGKRGLITRAMVGGVLSSSDRLTERGFNNDDSST